MTPQQEFIAHKQQFETQVNLHLMSGPSAPVHAPADCPGYGQNLPPSWTCQRDCPIAPDCYQSYLDGNDQPRYDVYYAKQPLFFDSGDKYGPPLYTVCGLDETHVFIRSVRAGSLDEVYHQMQGEQWSPNGEAAGLIISRLPDKPHTSMSVNDVVRDEAGNFYERLSRGWRQLQ